MFDGIILGILSWLSLVLSFKHLPNPIKQWLLKHFVITDLLSTLLTWFALSSISRSLAAVAGATVCGLLTNLSQMIYKRNPNGFGSIRTPAKPL